MLSVHWQGCSGVNSGKLNEQVSQPSVQALHVCDPRLSQLQERNRRAEKRHEVLMKNGSSIWTASRKRTNSKCIRIYLLIIGF